uniref:Uncharacterized protein n=1 Tax=Amphimedon queenslandica TaxID=400682 RepID=A0A1X7TBW3_AMPQE
MLKLRNFSPLLIGRISTKNGIMLNSSDCEDVPIGNVLLRLGISSSMLLAKDGVALTQIPKVTNAVVLDLHYFMSRQPKCNCTYKSLAEWLAHLFGDLWSKDMPPTVKAFTLSVKRPLAKRDKLKKLCSSSETDQTILEFMDEEYILPTIFQVKGNVYLASKIKSASSDCSNTYISNHDDSSELETLKSVNQDLSTQLRELKVENESLKETEGHFTVLWEKMYSLHRNTKKEIGQRDKQISEQSDSINKYRLDLDKLFKKFSQMESQVKQLGKDKDKLRHRVDY